MLERARTSGTGVVRALERVVVCGAPKYERLAIGSDLGGNQKNRVAAVRLYGQQDASEGVAMVLNGA